MDQVRVRMAPSPTGNLHLGTAYTTLFNYLFARKNKGVFILRIEDTDQARSKKEFEENILRDLKWLGLNWDEGPFRQTERLGDYKQAVQKLIDESKAFYCFCKQEELEEYRKLQQEKKLPLIYSGECRNLTKVEVSKLLGEGSDYIIRHKMPEDRGKIKFKDLILGEIEFDSKLIGDTVIMRKNGLPLYNFAVVVDDIDMKITHVLRAEDHISNTPKQIVLFEALGVNLPQFAHWPNILNPDRIGKLSKRENATAVVDYKKDGFLAEAIINYLALLGFTMPNDQEIMSLEEMVPAFDLSKMRKSPAAFDLVKLDWMNGEYIRKSENSKLKSQIWEYLMEISEGKLRGGHPSEEEIEGVVPLIKERIKKLSDFIPLTDFLWEAPDYDLEEFRKLTIDNGQLTIGLKKIAETLEKMASPWEAKLFEETFRKLAESLNFKVGDMFQLIRLAVSGQLVTPPLFESIQILGEDETLKRVKNITEKFPKIEDIGVELKVD